MNHKIEFDEISGMIVTDEETDLPCREYWYTRPGGEGTGVIAKTREECIKLISKDIRSDIKDLQRRVDKKKEHLDYLKNYI